ncbi:TetR family transcriptional regulator [Thermosporothrix hazakensis]|uniref:TetR family transcriptional regulator n=1 Tax=Thermosporothrix hazakensis TaxID=644383 RepID=UPI000DAED175
MKDRIIAAFIEELHEKGMKFSMDDLAKRLGISKRTLYEHFSSKVEILETIIEQTFRETEEKTQQILNNGDLSLLEKIRGVVTTLPAHNEFYDVRVLQQLKRYFPEQWARVNSALNDDWKPLRVLIEQGMREGVIKQQNVNLVMKLFIDAANSTLDQKFYLQNNLTISEALSTIVDILLYGLVAEEKR